MTAEEVAVDEEKVCDGRVFAMPRFEYLTRKMTHPNTSHDFGLSHPFDDGPETPQGSGELILVVDDEPGIRMFSEAILEDFGYRVLTAENAIHALSLFAQFHGVIDAVITDVAMQRMDGIALTRALKRSNPTLPIIVTSGMAEDSLLEAIREAGANTFLPKPYSMPNLLSVLDETLKSTAHLVALPTNYWQPIPMHQFREKALA
jgi:CheY-like chemotaxis protein